MDFLYLKNYMDELTKMYVPGNTVVVYKDGKKAFEYSSGYSNVENKIPMSTDKLLNIYSCSKIATVVAAMQLYEQGKFLLSDPLYEYIPEFNKMYYKDSCGNILPCGKNITIKNLFTMTSGITTILGTNAFEKAKEKTAGKMDTLEVIRCLAEEPLAFEPDEHWKYGSSHDVLAALVEVISGMRFSKYVEKNIFEKLGMENSFYKGTPEIENKMAEQYKLIANVEELKIQSSVSKGDVINIGKANKHIFGENYDSGGAGIISSAKDYVKLIAALSAGGIGLNNERILSPATIKLMQTNQLNENQIKDLTWPQLRGYGYGLGVRTMVDTSAGGSNGSVGEFGWSGAAGATAIIDTNENLAVFYAHHMLNPREDFYQPRLRNVVYSCLD